MTNLCAAQTLPVSRRTAPLSLLAMLRLHRSRRALTGLSDAALLDVGLTRAEADTEARRPFWDHVIPC
ncbi:DUF1127 domain-containing protein [Rhodobacteraceae bacterium KMM 6894]|nr:DUF1127 domain-containing protein [Rhodobacteraceae bacterium KMM 6894]